MDLSAAMLLGAAARGVRTVQADLDALPFRSDSFEAVFCFTAMVDRSSAAPGLSELARVVRPAGVVVLTLLPHDVPPDLSEVASACGLAQIHQRACGQDVGFAWSKAAVNR